MASKKDKYPWKIGIAPPPLDEHSSIKHDITAEYIRQYVHTLLSGYQWDNLKLTIVDGFSGGGRYTNDFTNKVVPGSPFIILDSIKQAQAEVSTKFNKPKTVEAEYHFVESERDYSEYLRNEISQSEYKDLVNNNLFLYNNKFETVAPEIIEKIVQRNKAQRAIFILDQFAYKDVPFNIVRDIMHRINKSEVILTFGFASLQSFLSENSSSQKAMQNIGLAQHIDWHRLKMLKDNGLWQHAIQEQLSHAIKIASGAKHMTLFFFEPKKGWTYWLVHLSKEYKARSVMMDIHWDNANTSGSFKHAIGDGIFALGFKAQKIANQAAFDFPDVMKFDEQGRVRCVDALIEDLPRFIHKNAPITFEKLLDLIGDFTAATESSIKDALQPAMDCNEIEVVNADSGKLRRKANSIKKPDTINYKQRPLFSLPNHALYSK